MGLRVLACLVWLGSAMAWAQTAPSTDSYLIRSDDSTLTYRLVHKLHTVQGVSKKLEGRARILPGGQAQIMVRAAVDTFDSGNSNRDAHMKETVESARYPVVELKATAASASLPTAFPGTLKVQLKAQVSFHGVQQMLDIPAEITWTDPAHAVATASFTISLEQFKIERPSLMFVKVNDDLKIEARITLLRDGAK